MDKKGKGKVVDENLWRTLIETATLNDFLWTAQVVMLDAAGGDQDRIYLNKFETFAANEKRFVIKNISKAETLFMVNQLGGEKKVKDPSVRVFEEGQLYLKDKRDIPSDLMALIIKHLILKMKDEYLFIQSQRLRVREGLRQESATMFDRTEVRGTVSVKPPEPPPPPEKSKKGKKEDTTPLITEPEEGKKYNTELRIRGEDWRDKVYVDDYPVDGPKLYIALTGFQEPELPWCLIKIGVPVKAAVQIRIDVKTASIPSTLNRPIKRGQSQTELLIEKSMKFWEDIQKLRIQPESSDTMKNTAFIIFTPPYWESDQLSGDDEKIYDELSFLLYDVQDLSRQHLNYLNNMKIIDIPEDEVDSEIPLHYHNLIDDLPLESVTIFSLLDSLLRTVCKNVDVNSESPKTNLSSNAIIKPYIKPTNIEKAENLIKEVFQKLTSAGISKERYRSTYGEEYENYKDPIILNFGDFSKNTTFHLGNINLDNIVRHTLLGMPVHQLWQNFSKPVGEEEVKINYHINVLLSCFDRKDIETTQLKRLIHVLACRKLYNNRSSNLKQHVLPTSNSEFKRVYLKRSILAEPLPKCPSLYNNSTPFASHFPSMTEIFEEHTHSTSDPESDRIQFLFDCPDISELVSAAEIKSNIPLAHNTIDDFDYFEDFSGISAFQILQDVFNKYNCVDYKYCEVTDSIILMFFNSHDQNGISREEWRSHVLTPICLQDFFDFILDECYDWIKAQETIYEDKLEFKKMSEYKDLLDVFATTSCIENTATIDNDLLIEGSLKYQEQQEAIEEQSPDITEIKSASRKTDTSYISFDSKSSKKKAVASSTPKKNVFSIAKSEIFMIQLPFTGYNLGDRRVEALGKDSIYFSRDGTKIITNYYIILPMNKEYVSLTIVSGNSINEIKIHKALGDFIDPDYMDAHESFRIICKDRAIINIKKQTYEVVIPPLSSTVIDTKVIINPMITPSSILSAEIIEKKKYYGFVVTWPNGLIIESVHETKSSEVSHIKQFYATEISGLNEDMRCISRAGEVVIFKTGGDIEVLRQDGTYILITKCEKRVIVPDVPESTISEATLKKQQKGKSKSQNKLSSKSKNFSADDLNDTKPLEYELHIEEYQIIETSGLKQQYSNNEFIDIDQLLIRTATDHTLGEIFSRRMDGTNILLNKDGLQTVTFKDNTRIISEFFVEEYEVFPEWTDEEREYFGIYNDSNSQEEQLKTGSNSHCSSNSGSSVASNMLIDEAKEEKARIEEGYVYVNIVYTIEHPNFATVTLDSNKIKVSSPNGTSVIMEEQFFDITLDEDTNLTFDGLTLKMNYEACAQCLANTLCKVSIFREPVTDDNMEVCEVETWWAKMIDSYSKKVIVDAEGGLSYIEEPYTEEPLGDPNQSASNWQRSKKSECSLMYHGKCREINLPQTLRFFVLYRNLSCSELIHRSIIEEYKTQCRWQPWCTINEYNAFTDNRKILSILSPIHLTETEKWLMDSKLANKPQYLAFKDLRKDEGKGFYHWMRPYERFKPKPLKPDNVLPPRLPRSFVLRTLELQWSANVRESCKGGKEILKAILKYRELMDSEQETILQVPVVDNRSEEEKLQHMKIQEFANRVYNELKDKLEEDMCSRKALDITTKPLPLPEPLEIVPEEVEDSDVMSILKDEEDLMELEEIEEMSPILQRYWRMRAEALRTEEFYKYLLREPTVAPYFHNVLGGAVWWELKHAAETAVNVVEGICTNVCADRVGEEENKESCATE